MTLNAHRKSKYSELTGILKTLIRDTLRFCLYTRTLGWAPLEHRDHYWGIVAPQAH